MYNQILIDGALKFIEVCEINDVELQIVFCKNMINWCNHKFSAFFETVSSFEDNNNANRTLAFVKESEVRINCK